MKKITIWTLTLAFALSVSMAFADEETVGEKIDRAGDRAGEKIEKAEKKVKKKLKNAKKKVEKKIEKERE